jgi:NADP-dependent 3-hydroxy acid dehydrogenase YdfG
MSASFDDRVARVTERAGGIGQAVTLHLTRSCCRVAMLQRSDNQLQQTAKTQKKRTDQPRKGTQR